MMASSSGVIIPEAVEIELLEPSRGGNAGFGEFVDLMNSAISKIVLSQTMTTDDGSSLSQSQVHMQVKQSVIKADASAIADSFNSTVSTWLSQWNYPYAEIPQLEFVTDIAEDLNITADRIATLCNATGYKPTIEYISETFGGEWEEVERDIQDAMVDNTNNVGNRPDSSELKRPDASDEQGSGDGEEGQPDKVRQ
jgi:phage gp29-like protein